MKIGVFLPNWVGDACMATPAVRALHRRFEDAELIGIGKEASLDVFQGKPWFCRTIHFASAWKSRVHLVSAMRDESLDAVVLFTNSLWTAAAAYFAKIPRRIGFARDMRTWLLTEPVEPRRARRKLLPVSAIDSYLQLVETLGCDVSDRRMEVSVFEGDRRTVDSLWREWGWSLSVPSVTINSSGAYGSSKHWPRDQVIALAKRLASDDGVQVLLHCGPREQDVVNRMAKECDNDLVRSLGGSKTHLPLGLSMAVLERSAVVVSTDSGPRHLAVALDRPVVSLFGPTSSVWTTTYNVPETIVATTADCRPCYQPSCPLKHHRCMQELTVDRVHRAVMHRLSSSQNNERGRRLAA